MSLKDTIIADIIAVEGGYVNDSCDSGGETRYGITKAVAVANGYTGPMCDMPISYAEDIYAAKYWDAVQADELEHYCPGLAAEVVDTAVNCGVSRSAKFLQRSLNALNDSGRYYADILVDGDIGQKTLEALEGYYLARRDAGMSVLIKMLNCLQGEFYVSLAEKREKDERFIYGWFKNRIA